MKNINEISKIIDNMPDDIFEKIDNADNDYYSLDKRISRNGYKRMVYNLKKVGLTVEEWNAWNDL